MIKEGEKCKKMSKKSIEKGVLGTSEQIFDCGAERSPIFCCKKIKKICDFLPLLMSDNKG